MVRRSILAVCTAVVVIAMVASIAAVTAASTSAATPTSKPFDWKSMCTKTSPDISWLPVCDLLKMVTGEVNDRKAADTALNSKLTTLEGKVSSQAADIAALKAQVVALQASQPYIQHGAMTASIEELQAPEGYSPASDCKVFVIPTVERFQDTTGDHPIYAISSHATFLTSQPGPRWVLISDSEWEEDNVYHSIFNNADYLMICQHASS